MRYDAAAARRRSAAINALLREEFLTQERERRARPIPIDHDAPPSAARDRAHARNARLALRNAENNGHSAACAIRWGLQGPGGIVGCNCPGRAGIVGPERARELDAIEETRRAELAAY